MNIGIFPIKNVLFPESILPLHIFEERYIKLINSAYKEKKPFGINLKKSGKIYDYGCLALVSDVTKYFDDGKMDVLLEGTKRFKVINISQGSLGYDIAKIELLENEKITINKELLNECVEVFNVLIDSIHSLDIKKMDIENIKSENPSYHIAQKAGLDLMQKNQLLKINSENERLEFLYKHLSRIMPMVKEVEFVAKIIKYDGYYKPLI